MKKQTFFSLLKKSSDPIIGTCVARETPFSYRAYNLPSFVASFLSNKTDLGEYEILPKSIDSYKKRRKLKSFITGFITINRKSAIKVVICFKGASAKLATFEAMRVRASEANEKNWR